MNAWMVELEKTLRELLDLEQQLLEATRDHLAATKSFDAQRLIAATARQAQLGLAIGKLQQKRHHLATQLGRHMRIVKTPTLTQLADLYPERKLILLQLRDELKRIAGEVRESLTVTARVVTATMGQLNQAIRLIAHAAGGSGTYSKTGMAKLPTLVGTLDAVG